MGNFTYDPTVPSCLRSNGKPVGWLDDKGYYNVKVEGKPLKAHNIIWRLHGRDIPIGYVIDHIKGKSNCIENLRLATVSQNAQNSKCPTTNTSGHKGVERHKGGWRVRISVGRLRRKGFGCYNDFELACLVADSAREKYHGQFAKHL